MTQRDNIRNRLATVFKDAKDAGINVDDFRDDQRSEAALARTAQILGNTSAPRLRRERLRTDNPPAGTMDGSNKEFTLSGEVLGTQIIVAWMDADGGPDLAVLARTDLGAPASGSFYFDGATTIRVGDAPTASDMLLAVYISTL